MLQTHFISTQIHLPFNILLSFSLAYSIKLPNIIGRCEGVSKGGTQSKSVPPWCLFPAPFWALQKGATNVHYKGHQKETESIKIELSAFAERYGTKIIG